MKLQLEEKATETKDSTQGESVTGRSRVPGLLGAVVIGLFLTVCIADAVTAVLMGSQIALVFLAIVAGYCLLWYLTGFIKLAGSRIFIRAVVAGILFTPMVGSRAIEWSLPWPPAAFWLTRGGVQGQVVRDAVGAISFAVALLSLAGWGLHFSGGRDSSRKPRASKPPPPNPPESPLVWPDDFPPVDGWKRFFIGVRSLGPDVSFFSNLKKQQAARTESMMGAWTDAQERRVAESLGKYFQFELEWKMPWFIPGDMAIAVLGGPSFGVWSEVDLWDLFSEFDEQLGTDLGPEVWSKLVNWEDKRVTFGEVVRKAAGRVQAGDTISIPEEKTVNDT